LLDEGIFVPEAMGADGCTFFSFHTILLDFDGVVVGFRDSSCCFHTFSFLGGVGTTLGISSFAPASFCFLYFSW
jgi:hypothetical protein